jgi:hypothetical protein
MVAGDFDPEWLGGIPGHQTIFMRTSLLRRLKFNLDIKVSADWDMLFRAWHEGAKFFNANCLVAVYRAGGFSAQNAATWIRNVWDISLRYTRDRQRADVFFEPLHKQYLKER